MTLNPDKSDAILLGTRQCSRCYATLHSVDVTGCSVSLSDHIRILGVTLDCHLSLDRHISSICKSAYYHIRSLRHIRSAISDDMAKSVASSLVCSCLDYANSLLYSITWKISISSASKTRWTESLWFMLSDKSHTHLVILKHLHWLPIEQRIHFKLAKLTHNTPCSVPLSLLTSTPFLITTLPHVLYALQTQTCCLFLMFALPLPPTDLVLQPPLYTLCPKKRKPPNFGQ